MDRSIHDDHVAASGDLPRRRVRTAAATRFVIAAVWAGAMGAACGGGAPLAQAVSPKKVLILFGVIVLVLAIGLYGGRSRD